jgi:hypothetical protein
LPRCSPPAGLSEKERATFDTLSVAAKMGNRSYPVMMGTRPQTIGYADGLSRRPRRVDARASGLLALDLQQQRSRKIPGRGARRHHAVLADEQRDLGGAAVLGDRRAQSNSGIRAGDTVAVLGIDGLYGRHRAGRRKGAAGAQHYFDSTTQDVAAELNKLGGARMILSTVTSAQAMSAVLGGLAIDGRMIFVGATPDPVEVSPLLLIGGRRGIQGWPSGTSIESEDTLAFSALANIRPMIETMPLERAAEAYERMMSGAARFRMVITTGQ